MGVGKIWAWQLAYSLACSLTCWITRSSLRQARATSTRQHLKCLPNQVSNASAHIPTHTRTQSHNKSNTHTLELRLLICDCACTVKYQVRLGKLVEAYVRVFRIGNQSCSGLKICALIVVSFIMRQVVGFSGGTFYCRICFLV